MNTELSRRNFIAAASAIGITALNAAENTPAPKVDKPKIKLGLIGCGGRGTWIADLFVKDGGYTLHAVADYFEDKATAAGDKFQVPAGNRFTGLNCYKKLIDSGVDAVAIESPPYFHPIQAAAAVEAGKHVYVAKPIAVDVPGCQSIAQSAKLATEKKQVFLVDFQTRANEFYIEALRRLHAGMLGDICFGEVFYHCDALGRAWEGDTAELRLRGWAHDTRLSGDIIVEQNIHCLDVMNWIMKTPPLRCTGTGGRKARLVGDTWDHYACLYEYPNDINFTFTSRQYKGFGAPGGIVAKAYGSKGILLTEYGGLVMIRGDGDVYYRGGRTSDIYRAGAATNIANFHKSIFAKDYSNTTVEPSVQSNLVAVLGRTATRKKKTVSWQEMLSACEKVDAGLSGLKA